MNRELERLYTSKWDILVKEANGLKSKAAYPLLIKVNQSYVDSDVKVMIVGQETDGWYGLLNEGSATVEELMNAYSDYFNQRSANGKKRGKRPFWNGKNYLYFERELNEYYSGKSVSFIWNNVSKIGNNGRGKPSSSIEQLERDYFDVFSEEFAILKPDVVIFTTGHTRDSYIAYHLGDDVQFIPKLSLFDGTLSDQTSNLLVEVKIPRYPDVKSIRIEHPNRRTLKNSVSLAVLTSLLEAEDFQKTQD
ncbi:hypothetical protein EBM76_15150 [Vibrio parahaemolyticus]|nr:hypothetical protein [Vibrio parahaemolyticus]